MGDACLKRWLNRGVGNEVDGSPDSPAYVAAPRALDEPKDVARLARTFVASGVRP